MGCDVGKQMDRKRGLWDADLFDTQALYGVEFGMNFVKKFAGNCKFLWMKNPKCFDKDGNMKTNLFGNTVDYNAKHGLVYDLETDKFIPIKK